MGFLEKLFGKKQDKETVMLLIKEYVNAHADSLIANWVAMQEELNDLTELERKEILKDEMDKITRATAEALKRQNIKVPAHLFQIVREELNDKIIELARPHISEFVYSYRRPYLAWPHPVDIPLRDLDKLKATLKENGVPLELLNYDLTDERIRSLLIQHEIRRKPEFQNAETWSRNFSYSHDDLILLAEVLKAKNIRIQGVEHVRGDLWILVKQELLRQQDSQFRKSFRKANPDLPEKPSRKEWAAAYVRALKNDLDYLGYVERMARLAGTIFEKGELEKLVREELAQKTPHFPGRSPGI
ncbi:MAG: hypothetical protein GXY92_10565 [Syntrophomonadaceae bacterium]|nr:hypothetical protein [Syntrophomonadaceae bacterium]